MFSLPLIYKVIILQSKSIGIWCNGNTADSGPAFPGSSPGIPTTKKKEIEQTPNLFFCIIISKYRISLT